MKNYIIRLDDACERYNFENWNKMEKLLDNYNIRPIVGIIPKCEDKDMENYPFDFNFWEKANKWQNKGWIMALHGYNHVFTSKSGGLNPINYYSEFAEIPLEEQKYKIKNGIDILKKNGINPSIFFAPAHTYDENTIKALKDCSDIRIISDTIASDIYCGYGELTYIPQQSGRVRYLPFKTVTFCYHPNTMMDKDFDLLEKFIIRNKKYFNPVSLKLSNRKLNFFDKLLNILYFIRR